jgi:cellulose synthase operon protein C
MRLRRVTLSRLVCLGFALMLTAGCSPAAHSGPRSPTDGAMGPVRAVAITDKTFAQSAYRVLVEDEPSQERANLLAGVVRHQLLRASQRFQAGEREAGLAALRGAFFLMRKGEFSQEMVQGGSDALREGAAEVARLGQEGSALALYVMLKGMLPAAAPERGDVDGHLEALKTFAASTRGSGALLAAAGDARRAVQRSLLEASPAAFDDAQLRLLDWLKRALASNAAEMPIQSNVDRDEVLEAYRALRGGGFAMVALYLRHGDARGALNALDEAGMERSIPPDMRESLERCADDNAPEAWGQFHQFFDSLAHDPQPVLAFDLELVNAATWGSALGLFRSQPGSLQGVIPLTSLLVDYGMAEVAPLALSPAVVKSPEPDQLGAALGMVLNAMIHEADLGQIEAARRTFNGAAPIFELAEARTNRGKVNPSPARLRYVMAALETSRGELERAKPLLEASAAAQPTAEVLTTLAALERQRKNHRQALDLLNRVTELGQRGADEALQGESAYTRFEIQRELGDAALAAQSLEAALRHALSAQKQSQPGAGQARAERLLARVLVDYGERPAAERATARAYQSSGADGRQLSATIVDASRRALTSNNLQAARQATQRALDATLPPEDMIYVALWLTLLEKKVGVASDGLVEEVLASFEEGSTWTMKLRAWARGRLDDAGLLAAARTKPEQTEALFYTTMGRLVRGDTNAFADLEKVAQSETVDLVEVGIARDLLAARQAMAFKLPANVTLP